MSSLSTQFQCESPMYYFTYWYNVGKTKINHLANHHFHRWYVYHSHQDISEDQVHLRRRARLHTVASGDCTLGARGGGFLEAARGTSMARSTAGNGRGSEKVVCKGPQIASFHRVYVFYLYNGETLMIKPWSLGIIRLCWDKPKFGIWISPTPSGGETSAGTAGRSQCCGSQWHHL